MQRTNSNKRSRNYENSMKIANKFSRCCQAPPLSPNFPSNSILSFASCLLFMAALQQLYEWENSNSNNNKSNKSSNNNNSMQRKTKTIRKATKHEKNSLISVYTTRSVSMLRRVFVKRNTVRFLRLFLARVSLCVSRFAFHNPQISPEQALTGTHSESQNSWGVAATAAVNDAEKLQIIIAAYKRSCQFCNLYPISVANVQRSCRKIIRYCGFILPSAR